MNKLATICACAALTAHTAVIGQVPDRQAAALVAQAIDAMGGRTRRQALRTVRTEAMGHDWHHEQSERPEGPGMTSYIQRTEIRDVAAGRLRRETQTRNWSRPAGRRPPSSSPTAAWSRVRRPFSAVVEA